MCWVDDDKDKLIVLDAYWPHTFSIPVQNTVRNDLTQGEHLLTCEILPETSDPTGGHEFRITTLTSWVALSKEITSFEADSMLQVVMRLADLHV
jgi:hypothetical protein